MAIGPEFVVKLGEEGAEKFRASMLKSETVADQLARSIVRLEQSAALKQAQASSTAYQKALEGATGATAQHAAAAAGATQSTMSMAGGFVTAANQAVQLAQQIAAAAGAVWDFAKAGATVADLQSAFTALGGSAADLGQLRDALAGTVDDAALMKMSNTARALGIDLSRLPELAGIAGKASLALGEDVGFMFDSIVKGTARESAMILDNLGVKIQDAAGQIDREYQRMGIAAEKATADQKAAAFAAVVANNAGKLAALDFASSQGAAYARVEASIKNQIDTMKMSAAAAIEQSGAFEAIAVVMEQSSGFFDDNKAAMQALLKDGVELLIDALPIAGEMATILIDAMKILEPAIRIAIPTLKLVNLPILALGEGITALMDLVEPLVAWIGRLADGAMEWADSWQVLPEVVDELRAAVKPLSDAWAWCTDKAGDFTDAVGITGNAVEAATPVFQNGADAVNEYAMALRSLDERKAFGADLSDLRVESDAADARRAAYKAEEKAFIDMQEKKERASKASSKTVKDEAGAFSYLSDALSTQWTLWGMELDRQEQAAAAAKHTASIQWQLRDAVTATGKAMRDNLRTKQFDELEEAVAASKRETAAWASTMEQAGAGIDTAANAMAGIKDASGGVQATSLALEGLGAAVGKGDIQAGFSALAAGAGDWMGSESVVMYFNALVATARAVAYAFTPGMEWAAAGQGIAAGMFFAAAAFGGEGGSAAAAKPTIAPSSVSAGGASSGSSGSSRSSSGSASKTRRETTIVQLMVDGRQLGAAAIGGVNQSLARGQGVRLNSAAIRNGRRSWA